MCLYKYLTTKEKIRKFSCSLLLMEKPTDRAKQHCPQELRSVFMPLWIRPTLFINLFPLGPQNRGIGHDSPLVSNCKRLCISLQENNTKTKVANHHILSLPIITELCPLLCLQWDQVLEPGNSKPGCDAKDWLCLY